MIIMMTDAHDDFDVDAVADIDDGDGHCKSKYKMITAQYTKV